MGVKRRLKVGTTIFERIPPFFRFPRNFGIPILGLFLIVNFINFIKKKFEDFEIESEIGHLGNQCFSEELISFKISVKSVPGWMMFSLEDVPFF